MAYRVELLPRARRDLTSIFYRIDAVDSALARKWFEGLLTAIRSLDTSPARCPVTPEYKHLRHLLYGKGRNVYRIIYATNDQTNLVSVIHIRHGAQQPFE